MRIPIGSKVIQKNLSSLLYQLPASHVKLEEHHETYFIDITLILFSYVDILMFLLFGVTGLLGI